MYIEKIYIDSFSAINSRGFDFSDGINIVEGDNETGKTTVGAFIKFLFYGFDSKAERERYIGFDAERAAGWMVVVEDGKRYRIERSVSASGREKQQIVDLSTNLRCYENSEPGDVFFGVPVSVFTSTAYVGQTDGGVVNGEKISSAMENILFSGDESANTKKALKKLDEARVKLLYKKGKGGEIAELRDEIDQLNMRLIRAAESHSGIISKESSLAAIKAKQTENSAALEKLREEIKRRELSAAAARIKVCGETEEKLNILCEAGKELEEKYRFGDILPTRRYADELKEKLSEIDYAEKAVKEAEKELNAARSPEYNIEERTKMLAFIAEKGGRKKILESISDEKQSKKNKLTAGVLLLILGVLCAAAAFVLQLVQPLLLIAAAFGAVLAAVGVIFILLSSGANKRIKAQLAAFGVESEEALSDVLDANLADEGRLEAQKHIIIEREAKLAECTSKLEAIKASAAGLLSEWGKTDLAAAVADAENALTAFDEYTRGREKLEERVKELKRILDEYTPEFLEEAKTADASAVPDPAEMAKLKKEREFLTKAIEAQKDRQHELELQLSEHYASAEIPAAVADEIYRKKNELCELEASCAALTLAYEKLSNAGEALRRSISPRLSEYAGKLMARVTDGRYTAIGVDTSLNMQYDTCGSAGLENHDIGFMSAGTADAAYISLRLALIDLLYRRSKPTVLFDESFARMDDKRLANIFKILSAVRLQTVIFTSQKREARIMEEVSAFKHIKITDN